MMELNEDYSAFVPTQLGEAVTKDYINIIEEIKKSNSLPFCLEKLCIGLDILKCSPVPEPSKNFILWASEMIAAYRSLGGIYQELYNKLEQDIKNKKVVAEDYWNWD